MRRITSTKAANNLKSRGTKEKRKELIEGTKDKILNINRTNENMGEECIICGKEIKKNQTFRALPKDKNCQEPRLNHLRTCGPGSNNWKTFKANGKRPLKKLSSKVKLSLRWKEKKH